MIVVRNNYTKYEVKKHRMNCFIARNHLEGYKYKIKVETLH